MLPLLLVACTPPTGAPPAEHPDIVLISMDTTRADFLGPWGNPDGATPNLDRFAREAVVFTQAYSQSTITNPSHTSLLTSRYPSEFAGEDRPPVLGADKPLLGQVLGAYGYRTAAFVAGGDLSPSMGLTGGFAEYWSSIDFGSLYHTAPKALEWLDAQPAAEPRFVFVHGYDAHAPYLEPAPWGFAFIGGKLPGNARHTLHTPAVQIVDGRVFRTSQGLQAAEDARLRYRDAEGRAMTAKLADDLDAAKLKQRDLDALRHAYEGGIYYGDMELGKLLAGLRSRGELDRAIVVVIGDHGEQLGEHGIFGHSNGVGDEETHVPLLVRLPGGKLGGTRVDGLVGLIDLMPTLLELVGVTAPAGIHGHSFAAALRGEPFAGDPAVYTQGDAGLRAVSARTTHGRLTWTGLFAGSTALPKLLTAVPLDSPGYGEGDLPVAERAPVRDGLVAWLATLTPSPLTPAATPLPESLKAELRAHGYFDAQ